MQALNHTTRHLRREAGFTLSETLVALAVFLIGFIAVAALFPAAALLQKQTMDQVQTRQFSNSVKALFTARKFEQSRLLAGIVDGNPDTTGRVHRFLQNSSTKKYGGFTLRDRSWPAIEPIINGESGARYFFVPLVIDGDREQDRHDWQVFVMILQRDGTAKYAAGSSAANLHDPEWVPKVNNRNASRGGSRTINVTTNPGEFIKGDKVLGSNGYVYTVTDVGNNSIEIDSFVPAQPPLSSIWFAKPGDGNRSPLREIVVIASYDAVIPTL